MVQTSHTPGHDDHGDPAEVLRALIERDRLSPQQWEDEERHLWVLERLTDEDGTVVVLSILNSRSELVCQASHRMTDPPI